MITLLYFVFIIFFIASGNYKKRYMRKALSKNRINNQISIVVPAMNEEENIDDIILSTINQNYPSDKFEVILVNDRSSDNTGKIADSYAERFANLKVVHITENKTGLAGKQNALDVGIKNSKGDIILITDADCIINRNWIKCVNRLFQDEVTGLVVGKTKILSSSDNMTMLEKIQIIADRLLMEVAQVPIMFGFYTSGMGNNLAFKKQAYLDLGGYEGLGDSILDDEILVRGFARKGHRIAAMFNDNGVVSTKPMKDWNSLIKQHKRWIAGSLNIFTPSGVWTFAYYFVNLYTIFLLLKGEYFAILKFVGDYMLYVKLNRADEKKVLSEFEEFIYPIVGTLYTTYVATLAIINPRTSWKNQKYKASKIRKSQK